MRKKTWFRNPTMSTSAYESKKCFGISRTRALKGLLLHDVDHSQHYSPMWRVCMRSGPPHVPPSFMHGPQTLHNLNLILSPQPLTLNPQRDPSISVRRPSVLSPEAEVRGLSVSAPRTAIGFRVEDQGSGLGVRELEFGYFENVFCFRMETRTAPGEKDTCQL